ncbi:MAG: hypothetical protein AB7P23_10725 [Amphiplicatus sp.]
MTPGVLKQAASALLLATGVFHLIVAVMGAPSELKIPLVVFGVGYFGLGIWTRMGGRTAFLTTILVTALGIVFGGQYYLAHGGPATLPVACAVNVFILAACALWLVKMKSGAED